MRRLTEADNGNRIARSYIVVLICIGLAAGFIGFIAHVRGRSFIRWFLATPVLAFGFVLVVYFYEARTPGLVPFAPEPDYLTNFDQNTVLHNPSFLSDVKKYYEMRDGRIIFDDDDLRSLFFQDRRFVNSIGFLDDWLSGKARSNEMNALESKLQFVYWHLPFFWDHGGAR
jgi:hypothetical protein